MYVRLQPGMKLSICNNFGAFDRKVEVLFVDGHKSLIRTVEKSGVLIPDGSYHLVGHSALVHSKSELPFPRMSTLDGMVGWHVYDIEMPVTDYDQDDSECI